MAGGTGGMVHVHADVRAGIRRTARWLGLWPTQMLTLILVWAASRADHQSAVLRHVRFFRRFKRYRRLPGLDTRLNRRGKQVLARFLRAWHLDQRKGYRVVIVRGAWTAWCNAHPDLVRIKQT